MSAGALPADASTTPVSYERWVSARCEIQVGFGDERIVDEDFVHMTEEGLLDDERRASLAFGQSFTESSASQTSLLSPELFSVAGAVAGVSRNDEELFICQASPVSSAEYRFEVDELTPYRFSGRLDGTGGGSVVFRLDAAFGGENIILEFTADQEIVLDYAGELAPGTYDLRVETSAYISPGADQWATFSIDGSFGVVAESPELVGHLPATVEIAPNPIRRSAWISLGTLAEAARSLAIVDPTGRKLRTFALDGAERLLWDRRDDRGRQVSSGVYFVVVDGATRGRAVLLQ